MVRTGCHVYGNINITIELLLCGVRLHRLKKPPSCRAGGGAHNQPCQHYRNFSHRRLQWPTDGRAPSGGHLTVIALRSLSARPRLTWVSSSYGPDRTLPRASLRTTFSDGWATRWPWSRLWASSASCWSSFPWSSPVDGSSPKIGARHAKILGLCPEATCHSAHTALG